MRGRGTSKFGLAAGDDGRGSSLCAWGGEDPNDRRPHQRSPSWRASRADKLLDGPLEGETVRGRKSPSRRDDARGESEGSSDSDHRKHRGPERPLEPENGQRQRPKEPDSRRRHNERRRKRPLSEEKPATSWIRVDNIPPQAEGKHFQLLFSSTSTSSSSAKVISCMVKGDSAFVHFERAQSAVQAVKQFNGGEMNGQLIAVQLEFSPPERSPERWADDDEVHCPPAEAEKTRKTEKKQKKDKKEKRSRH